MNNACSTEDQWQTLAQAVQREVASRFPGWTSHDIHDPGMTLVELLAFLAENLLYRADRISMQERTAVARRLASLATALASPGTSAPAPERDAGLQRVNYFFGQVLGVDDFTAEQDYFREKSRRLNRLLHGVGIVTGLGVSVEAGSRGARVVIEPGFAIEPRGEEIEVPHRASVALPKQGTPLIVHVRYAERGCRPVPAASGDPQSDAQQDSRIEETFEAFLSATADATAVPIARVSHVKRRWRLDRHFKAPHVGK